MNSIDPPGSAAALPAGLPNDVLVVEDDPLIAFDASETIRSFGVTAVRTSRTVASALTMIAERAPDFVLLDVGLIKEKSFAVAEQLERLKIPFAFVTGYSSRAGVPERFARHPVLNKPYLRDALLQTIVRWRDPL